MGNPFGRKPSWKLRLLYSLSLNGKWMQVKRSDVCGSWATVVHKYTLFSLSLICDFFGF